MSNYKKNLLNNNESIFSLSLQTGENKCNTIGQMFNVYF